MIFTGYGDIVTWPEVCRRSLDAAYRTPPQLNGTSFDELWLMRGPTDRSGDWTWPRWLPM